MNDNFKKIGGILARSAITKVSLPVILIVVGLLLLVVIIAAAIVSNDMGESGSIEGGNKELPESVLRWEEDISESIVEYGLDPEYLPIMLAILYQESKGDLVSSNGDIFQSSESKCGSIGCITDPKESINQAVKHFKNNVSQAKGNKEVAIASYNFGNGFADWTQKNHDNKWSREIAIEFSQYMMGKVSNPENYTCIREEAKEYDACYGDILYVPSILAFTADGSEKEPGTEVDFTGDLNFPIQPVRVTSNFGKRLLNGQVDGHKGIDLGCIGGVTPIYAAGAGQVVYSEFNAGGYGNSVIIKHENGFYTQYAHMSMLDIDKDDYVDSGDKIGVCGNTGNSYGAHLHFETKEKEWEDQMNPRDFLDFPGKQ